MLSSNGSLRDHYLERARLCPPRWFQTAGFRLAVSPLAYAANNRLTGNGHRQPNPKLHSAAWSGKPAS